MPHPEEKERRTVLVLYANALFFGKRFGPVLSLNDNTFEIGAVFALEKSINDNISLGVLPSVLSVIYDGEVNFAILYDWRVYAVFSY